MTALKPKLVLNVREFFAAFVGAMLALSLTGCYTVKQAIVFNNMYNSRVPLKNAAKDMQLSDRERKNLLKVPQILAFAKTNGLNVEGAYNYYIRMNEPVVSYSLQAAKPLEFEFETWWFPIVGRVPYLGFFSKEERDQKVAELEGKGLDVNTSGVAAFSSLGWFDDPIYTSMVSDEEIELVHLLSHELTHRTYWSPGSTEFNENLAEFVGGYLTLEYFKAQINSEQVKDYLLRREDNKVFKTWLVGVRKKLEVVYQNGVLSDGSKLTEKKQILAAAIGAEFPVFKTKNYQALRDKKWNNAAILAFTLYLPNTEIFEKAFKCYGQGNMGDFLSRLKELESQTNDSFKALDQFCAPNL